jgi:DNA-binding GntR family transcriptional regulator
MQDTTDAAAGRLVKMLGGDAKQMARTANDRKTGAAAEEPRTGLLGKGMPTAMIRSERVADQVYRHLRRAILSGEIEPGARLREVEVSQAMQISRTPVREAISRLLGDALVRELQFGGVEVVDTASELEEISVIREALEISAGRLAAARISEHGLAELAALADQLEAVDYTDLDERERLNAEFHMTLIKSAGSPRLMKMIQGFQEFFVHRRRDPQDQATADLLMRDHRDLIRALRARDGENVAEVIRRHLANGNMASQPEAETEIEA